MIYEEPVNFNDVHVGQIMTCRFEWFNSVTYAQVEIIYKYTTWCTAVLVKKVGENCIGLASVSSDGIAHLNCSNFRQYPVPNTYIKTLDDAMHSLGL